MPNSITVGKARSPKFSLRYGSNGMKTIKGRPVPAGSRRISKGRRSGGYKNGQSQQRTFTRETALLGRARPLVAQRTNERSMGVVRDE